MSSRKPLAFRDFTGPRDFVKAANEEHARRLGKPATSAALEWPWSWLPGDTSGPQRIQFLGVTLWGSLGTLERAHVIHILRDAGGVARTASVWADE